MPERVAVLEIDADLRRRLTPDRLRAAGRASVASVVTVGRGAWEPDAELGRTHGGYGLLVLDGLMARRLRLGDDIGAELLAFGDLLGAADRAPDAAASLAASTSWQAIETTRLARLDAGWAARMAEFPEVADALGDRALARSSRLLAAMALTQHHALDERVWRLFWQLADRFGHVHPDGVRLQLPMTHELIAQLAFARRPSVSTALGRLARAGRVRRKGRYWVLTGPPPPELSKTA